jgi:hypothetical protein
MVYNLQLAEQKVKPHQVTTLHLVSSLAFIGAGAIIVIYNYTIPGWGLALLLAGLALLSLTIFKNKWLTTPAINPVFRTIEMLLAATFAIYSFMLQWKFPIVIYGGLTAALLFSLYWERMAGNKLSITVDDNGLRLPVVRRRFIPWTEIDNVVLRYGTITINCLDNHLFQWTVNDPDFDSQSFEAFCVAKVEENVSKRIKDDW